MIYRTTLSFSINTQLYGVVRVVLWQILMLAGIILVCSHDGLQVNPNLGQCGSLVAEQGDFALKRRQS